MSAPNSNAGAVFNPNTGEFIQADPEAVKRLPSDTALLTGRRAEIARDLANSERRKSEILNSKEAQFASAISSALNAFTFNTGGIAVDKARALNFSGDGPIYSKERERGLAQGIKEVQAANPKSALAGELLGSAGGIALPTGVGLKAAGALGLTARGAKLLQAGSRVAAFGAGAVVEEVHDADIANRPLVAEQVAQHAFYSALGAAAGEVAAPFIHKLGGAVYKTARKGVERSLATIYKAELAESGPIVSKAERAYRAQLEGMGGSTAKLRPTVDEPLSPKTQAFYDSLTKDPVAPKKAVAYQTSVSKFLDSLKQLKEVERFKAGLQEELGVSERFAEAELITDPFKIDVGPAPVVPEAPTPPIGRGKGGKVTPTQQREYAEAVAEYQRAKAEHPKLLDDYHAKHLEAQANSAEALQAARDRAALANERAELSSGAGYDDLTGQERDTLAMDSHFRDILGHGAVNLPVSAEDAALGSYEPSNPDKFIPHEFGGPAPEPVAEFPKPPPLPDQRLPGPDYSLAGPKIPSEFLPPTEFEAEQAATNFRNQPRPKYEPVKPKISNKETGNFILGSVLSGGGSPEASIGYKAAQTVGMHAGNAAAKSVTGSLLLGLGIRQLDRAAANYLNNITIQAGGTFTEAVSRPYLSRLGIAVDHLFKAGSQIPYKLTHSDVEKSYEALQKATNVGLTTPEILNNHLERDYGQHTTKQPETFDKTLSGTHSAVAEVSSLMPTQRSAPTVQQYPSSVTYSTMRRAVTHAQMVGNVPLGISNPNPAIIAFYNNNYPATMEKVKSRILQKISDPKILARMTPEQKQKASIILGVPVTIMQEPAYRASLQQLAQSNTIVQQPAPQGSKASKPSTTLSGKNATIGAPESLQQELP